MLMDRPCRSLLVKSACKGCYERKVDRVLLPVFALALCTAYIGEVTV